MWVPVPLIGFRGGSVGIVRDDPDIVLLEREQHTGAKPHDGQDLGRTLEGSQSTCPKESSGQNLWPRSVLAKHLDVVQKPGLATLVLWS